MPESDNFGVAFEELLDDRFLLGTAGEAAEQILALQRRFGVNYFCVSVHLAGTPKQGALEQMQILAEEVFPRVAGGGLARPVCNETGRQVAAMVDDCRQLPGSLRPSD